MLFRRIYTLLVIGTLILVCLLQANTVYELYRHDPIGVSIDTAERALSSTITTELHGIPASHFSADFKMQTVNKSVKLILDKEIREQVKIGNKTERRVNHEHRMTVIFQGRLGNLMFEFASLLGIAKKNNLVPLVPRSLNLFNYFRIKSATLTRSNKLHKNAQKYVERKACTFEQKVMDLGGESDVLLRGFFQSWKYIHSVSRDVRENFKWKEEILQDANQQLQDSVGTVTKSNVLVGVHVRRGDMSNNAHMMKYGFISADLDYLITAINHYRSKYVDVLFVVVSDDMDWCSHNLNGTDIRFINKENKAGVDMAILSLCEHTVITSGSFGWWAAWLAGGEVVYFKGYPRPNSKVAAIMTPADYVPPSWIGF